MSAANPASAPLPSSVAGPQLPSRPHRGWRRLGWLLLVILLAGGSFFWMQQRAENPQATVRYKTEPATRGNLEVTVTATGNLDPTNQVKVGSEQSGIVEKVLVDCNDHVKVGQILAQIDPAKLTAQYNKDKAALASARAQVLSAQATVKEARNELARLTELRKISIQKAVSQHELDAAQATLDRALAEEGQMKATVNQAESALSSDQTDLGKLTIRSPIDGVVLTRSIDPGQTVAASFEAPELFELAEDLSKMRLNVGVDEADVGAVKAGQSATFTVDAYPDQVFPAKIDRVNYGSETTDGVVTYETVLTVDNSGLMLRPGMTATATITVKKIEKALLIPNSALRFTPPAEEKPQQSSGSLFDKIMPHPPASQSKSKTEVKATAGQSTIWKLEGNQLVPLSVTLGSSDGKQTEVVGGDLTPETQLVVELTEVKS